MSMAPLYLYNSIRRCTISCSLCTRKYENNDTKTNDLYTERFFLYTKSVWLALKQI